MTARVDSHGYWNEELLISLRNSKDRELETFPIGYLWPNPKKGDISPKLKKTHELEKNVLEVRVIFDDTLIKK